MHRQANILSPCSVIIWDQKKLNRSFKDAFLLFKINKRGQRQSYWNRIHRLLDPSQFRQLQYFTYFVIHMPLRMPLNYCCSFFFKSIITYCLTASLNHQRDFILFPYICTEFRLIYINNIQKINSGISAAIQGLGYVLPL